MANRFTAVRIDCEGQAQIIDLHAAPQRRPFGPTLSGLYATIGCDLVEPLDIGTMTMWLDEEGRLTDQPTNPVASAIADAALMLGYPLNGVAVVTGGVGDDGESLPLSMDQVNVLTGLLAELEVKLTVPRDGYADTCSGYGRDLHGTDDVLQHGLCGECDRRADRDVQQYLSTMPSTTSGRDK